MSVYFTTLRAATALCICLIGAAAALPASAADKANPFCANQGDTCDGLTNGMTGSTPGVMIPSAGGGGGGASKDQSTTGPNNPAEQHRLAVARCQKQTTVALRNACLKRLP